MVGGLDDIQVVLDDHHGVARLHQTLEHLDEPVDVIAVQAGGGLIQDIDGLAGGALGQLGGQLDPLGLAAGQLGGGLPQLDIAQPHIHQGLEPPVDPGQVLEEGEGLLHCHLQNLIDIFPLIPHLQGLTVVPLALAHLAGDVDVRQEVHLDLQQAVPLTCLAPAAPHIEGEAARAVAPAFSVLGGGEQVPDVVEQPGVGGRIGPGRAPDGGLVDVDDLVQELLPLQAVVSARPSLGPVQVAGQPVIEDLVDQGGLSAARHAGHRSEGPQREGHVDVAQIVLRRPQHLQVLSVPLPALLRHRDLPPPGEVVAGEGAGGVHDLLRCAAGHDLSAVDAGPGAHVHDIVGGPHGVLIVLHHQQGVAQVPQVLHSLQQHVIVPLVQADGGLVQNIQHSHQRGADLGGQPDALALAAGQAGGAAGQGQVLEPHRPQEAQPLPDLLQDPLGDAHLGLSQGQLIHELQGVVH